jgi:hypothetical protein
MRNYDDFFPVSVSGRQYFVGDGYELCYLSSPTKKPQADKSGDLTGQEMPPFLNMTCLGNKSFMGLNASLTVRKVAPSY